MEQESIKKYAFIHKGAKPYKCQFCEHTFSQKIYMARHVLSMHETKKSFKFEPCDYWFSGKAALNKHIVSVHEGKKPFRCGICDYPLKRVP